MPSGSTAQVARPARSVAVSDDRRSQRSATVNTAIAKLGPALLTNGVNRTPTSVAAMQMTATETTVATGHLRRATRGAAARTPNTATASGDPLRDATPAKTGSVRVQSHLPS